MAVIDTLIEKESCDRYLTYALSVISGRALPDVRDGLKPVQRRILYAMYKELGLTPDKAHRKSATVIGNVLGHFHPHGDSACYEAMVRLAQDFSVRYTLVDGQGNFGSMDGDSAAAYRYTETKLKPIAIEVLGEIDEETVDFRPNFDSTVVEPTVLPSKVPLLLINGASGIAVGMATNIPPHNLKDVCKAVIELANDPEISETKLAGVVKAPDFPTGGLIINSRAELNEIYKTGKGSVRLRGQWELEEGNRGKRYIIVTAIPYAVNKSDLVEKIADLIIQRKVPQLNDVRDESTDTVRVVLELAPGAEPEQAMAYLFKNTPLETNFAVNMTALVPTGGVALKPEVLSLKSALNHFLIFREEVVRKRHEFERKKLLERIHILEGLVAIYDRLDEALKIIRASNGRSDAAEKLRGRFKLTEIQSLAIVDMRLYQLSKTTIEEIRAELHAKETRVAEIDALLKSKVKILGIVKKELEELAEKFGDKRRTELAKGDVELEFNEANYVVVESVYAIVTADGWVKRIRQNNELSSTRLRDGDRILAAHALTTLDSVAMFTNLGNLYVMKVNEFPASSGYGDPVQKILKFKDGEQIVASFSVVSSEAKPAAGSGEQKTLDLGAKNDTLKDGDFVTCISARGMGFVFKVTELATIKRSGRRAMKVRDGDALVAVSPKAKKVAIATESGIGLVIAVGELPENDSPVVGVIAMGIKEGDKVAGAVCFDGQAKIKLITTEGKEKIVESKEFTEGHRALKGTKISRDTLKRIE
jgi:DNA gyrase subunit A